MTWWFTKTSTRSIIDAAGKGVEVADESGAILNPRQRDGSTTTVHMPGAPTGGIKVRAGGATAEGKAIGAGVGAIVGLAKKGRKSILIYAR